MQSIGYMLAIINSIFDKSKVLTNIGSTPYQNHEV